MTNEEFQNLREGDIVQAKASGMGYIIVGKYKDRAIAVRTVEITNPDEWELIEWELIQRAYRFFAESAIDTARRALKNTPARNPKQT